MDISRKEIRSPIVEGLFYPADADRLREKTETLLKEGAPLAARIILCPHGSWEHCGSSWEPPSPRRLSLSPTES